MNEYLQEGDVIRIKKGHKISTILPNYFFYTNGKMEENDWHFIIVGTICNGFDTSLYARDWIVVKTAYEGGGTGYGPNDVYPDGHHVYCEDVSGLLRIRFYQSGCFHDMIKPGELEKIGKAKATWFLGEQ